MCERVDVVPRDWHDAMVQREPKLYLAAWQTSAITYNEFAHMCHSIYLLHAYVQRRRSRGAQGAKSFPTFPQKNGYKNVLRWTTAVLNQPIVKTSQNMKTTPKAQPSAWVEFTGMVPACCPDNWLPNMTLDFDLFPPGYLIRGP